MIDVRDDHRVYLRGHADRTRDLANEISARYGCDDPLHPVTAGREFRDYTEFIQRVALPLVEGMEANETVDAETLRVQEAMKLYRTVSPFWICVSMLMMWRRLETVTPRGVAEDVLKLAERYTDTGKLTDDEVLTLGKATGILHRISEEEG